MQTFLYDENTLELLKHLLRQPPKRIFSDEFMEVVFDYGNFHIIAFPEDFAAASQNDTDEAIRIKFTRLDSVFVPRENERVLFENALINRLWILRTLLYFTDHVTYESKEQAIAGLLNETETDKKILEVLENVTGGHDEVVCHPKGEVAAQVNKDFANLIDVGVALEINDKCFVCFSQNNSFSAKGQIVSLEELEEIAGCYDFIEVSI